MKLNEPLAPRTSFGIGGAADLWAEPEDAEDLVFLLDFLEEAGVHREIFGRGTNLLVMDGGVEGAVVGMRRLRQVSFAGRKVSAGAGAPLSGILGESVRRGLSGLEFAAGIPASAGGAAATNAGGRFGDMKGVLTGAVLLCGGDVKRKDAGEPGLVCGRSRAEGARGVVVSVELELKESEPAAVKNEVSRIMKYRMKTQPVSVKSAGCVFKNPGGMSAGRMISGAGLSGRRIGGAEISRKHANYIINRGGASSADVLALIHLVEEEVFKVYNVELEREVEIIGG